jgi:hypothetical protein
VRSALWTGQSERTDSAHFSDQREIYIANRHKSLSLDESAVRAKSKGSLKLQYARSR